MPTATADGAAVHYATRGTGPALVLVAGTGLTAEITYGHLVPAFADRRTIDDVTQRRISALVGLHIGRRKAHAR